MGVYDMIKELNPESRLFGFLMGPHGVYSNNYMEICGDYMELYRNMGGFDMICKLSYYNYNHFWRVLFFFLLLNILLIIIGSGRHKIETPE